MERVRLMAPGIPDLGFHTIDKEEEEAIDHRVVNGDDFLRTMLGATLGLREN